MGGLDLLGIRPIPGCRDHLGADRASTAGLGIEIVEGDLEKFHEAPSALCVCAHEISFGGPGGTDSVPFVLVEQIVNSGRRPPLAASLYDLVDGEQFEESFKPTAPDP